MQRTAVAKNKPLHKWKLNFLMTNLIDPQTFELGSNTH